MRLLVNLIVLLAGSCDAAAPDPHRVLYVTTSAGYRHASIPVSIDVLNALAAKSGRIVVTATEDLSLINAGTLKDFDAVFFFTSGELELSGEQKTALLDFVRGGKGFGGVHSASDTLYSWSDYGELLGGIFDGHPWVQNAGVLIEDADNPIVRDLAPRFEIIEEIYQFRNFSRDRVQVLARLDTTTVDLAAEGVHRTDGDFALVWRRAYGAGRVFYTALGHFDETWRDERFQKMILNALLWLTCRIDIVNGYGTSTHDSSAAKFPGPPHCRYSR